MFAKQEQTISNLQNAEFEIQFLAYENKAIDCTRTIIFSVNTISSIVSHKLNASQCFVIHYCV